MRTQSILSIAIFAALAVAAPAFAQDDTSQSVKVSLAGLDFGSREGASEALRRINAAATAVCGDRPDILDLPRGARFEHCRSAAVNGAVQTVNRPLLSLAAGFTAPPMMVAAR